MDAPEVLQYLSESKGVHSTHLQNPESMQQLADKTRSLAAGWKPLADSMFQEMTVKEKKKIELILRNFFSLYF